MIPSMKNHSAYQAIFGVLPFLPLVGMMFGSFYGMIPILPVWFRLVSGGVIIIGFILLVISKARTSWQMKWALGPTELRGWELQIYKVAYWTMGTGFVIGVVSE